MPTEDQRRDFVSARDKLPDPADTDAIVELFPAPGKGRTQADCRPGSGKTTRSNRISLSSSSVNDATRERT
jgi:hypothetical protein